MMSFYLTALLLLTTPSLQAQDPDGVHVLYRTHHVTAMDQGKSPACVGAAYVKALEMIHGVKFSAEWSFGTSRSHAGASDLSVGSYCQWAVEAARDVGVLPARNYAAFGYDLTEFIAQRATNWGRGPPEPLEWVAANYKSKGGEQVKSWNELQEAVRSGKPVIFGSMVGFGPKSLAVRDSRGVLRSRWWSRWPHAMLICGVSDDKALVLNSWGDDWISGPKWLGDEPEGSFWITKSTAEKILSYDDSYAVLPIIGM